MNGTFSKLWSLYWLQFLKLLNHGNVALGGLDWMKFFPWFYVFVLVFSELKVKLVGSWTWFFRQFILFHVIFYTIFISYEILLRFCRFFFLHFLTAGAESWLLSKVACCLFSAFFCHFCIFMTKRKLFFYKKPNWRLYTAILWREMYLKTKFSSWRFIKVRCENKNSSYFCRLQHSN